MVLRTFSTLHMYLKFRHHPHPLGYLFFFCGLHCWASPWRRITYSITQSVTHPPYLMPWETKLALQNNIHYIIQAQHLQHTVVMMLAETIMSARPWCFMCSSRYSNISSIPRSTRSIKLNISRSSKPTQQHSCLVLTVSFSRECWIEQ